MARIKRQKKKQKRREDNQRKGRLGPRDHARIAANRMLKQRQWEIDNPGWRERLGIGL